MLLTDVGTARQGLMDGIRQDVATCYSSIASMISGTKRKLDGQVERCILQRQDSVMRSVAVVSSLVTEGLSRLRQKNTSSSADNASGNI